jgi:hypothetical protein
MIASVTELNLKNFWGYLRFIPHAIRSKIQADKAKGIISISLKSDGFLVQRTLTVWEDEASMKNYVRSGWHLKAMKDFSKMANKSYVVKFEIQKAPSWEEAIQYLRTHGREIG